MKREEAIHFATCLKNNWTINFADMEEFCDMAIEALSAEAVQGEWIFRTDIPIGGGRESAGFVCTNCGKDYFQKEGLHFCPNCGARMKGGDSK